MNSTDIYSYPVVEVLDYILDPETVSSSSNVTCQHVLIALEC
jgi:hypothetical protein